MKWTCVFLHQAGTGLPDGQQTPLRSFPFAYRQGNKGDKTGGGILLCLQGYLSKIQYIRVPWVGGAKVCRGKVQERNGWCVHRGTMALSSWLRHCRGQGRVLLSHLNSKEKDGGVFLATLVRFVSAAERASLWRFFLYNATDGYVCAESYCVISQSKMM